MSRFQEHVREARKRSGKTLADVVRDSGGLLKSETTVSDAENKHPHKLLSDNTIRGLANGLPTSERALRELLAEALDLLPPDDRDPGMLAVVDMATERLDPEQRVDFIKAVSSMLDAVSPKRQSP